MRTHSKLILAALAATMLLALGVSTATAGRFSVNEKNFEVIWNRALGAPKTNLEFIAGSSNVQCAVTLLGSFVERTIKKETALRQNTINHAVVEGERCEGGTATVRTETLPWESKYRSFTGTLPTIRSITIGLIRAAWRIRETNGIECEAATSAANPGVGIIGTSAEVTETGLERTGEPENLTVERGNTIPLSGFICGFAGGGRFGGIGLVRNLPATAKIRVTLI